MTECPRKPRFPRPMDSAPRRALPLAPATRSIHPKAWRAPRRDTAIVIVTDENRHLYVRECASAEQLACPRETNRRPAHLIVPALVRRAGWLPGDVMLIAVDAAGGSVRGALRLASTVGPVERYELLRAFAPVQRSTTILHLDALDSVSIRDGTDVVASAPASLLAGLQRYALGADIEQISAVVDMSWLPLLLDLGWNPSPLGLPREVKDSAAIAVLLDVSEVALRRTRQILSVAGPMMVRRGLTRRAPPDPDEPRLLS